jgi:inner membrane protein COX18
MNKEKLGPETPFAAIVELNSKNNKLLKATRKQMYKSWKIKPWAKYTPITLLPMWLSMIEALRRMSGFPSLFGSENTISAPLEPSLATEGALWFPDLLVADPYYVLPVMLSATIYVNLISGWKATTREELAAMENRQRRQAKTFNALRRVLQCAALASGPIAMYSGAPAGVLIYWISSTAIATMQRRILLAGRSTAPPKPAVDNGIAILKSKSATST